MRALAVALSYQGHDPATEHLPVSVGHRFAVLTNLAFGTLEGCSHSKLDDHDLAFGCGFVFGGLTLGCGFVASIRRSTSSGWVVGFMESSKGHSPYRYNSALAREMVDLLGVRIDLEAAAYLILEQKKTDDLTVRRGLYTAALITYRRCFKDSARQKLSTQSFGDIDGGPEYHKHLMALADKYAAHSVNPFEQLIAGALVIDNAVAGVMSLRAAQDFIDDEEADQFARFIGVIVQTIVAPAYDRLEAAVRNEAMAAPIEQILRAGTVKFSPAPPESAHLARR